MSSTSTVTKILNRTISKYISAASGTLYFYDLLLTWNDELVFFWNGEGGWLIRTLFILNRYLPVIGSVSPFISYTPFFSSKTGCQAVVLISVICRNIGVVAATAIFCFRGCTLYKGVPIVRYILLSSYWISTLPFVIIGILTIYWMEPAINFSNGSCGLAGSIHSSSAINAIGFLAPLLCEVVVILAIGMHALGIRYRRNEYRRSSVSSVLLRLYQDGSLYFVVIFGLRIFNCLLWYLSPAGIIAGFLEFSLTSVLTSRFFFALRKLILNLQKQSPGTESTLTGVGATINFELPAELTTSIVPKNHSNPEHAPSALIESI